MRVPLGIAGAMSLVAVLGCVGCLVTSVAAVSALSTLSPEEIVYGKELAKRYPSPGRVGQLQSSAGIELTVLKVETGARKTLGSAGHPGFLVDVLVAVKNAGLESFQFERRDFKLSVRDGLDWRPLLPNLEQSLLPGTLARGEAAAGWLQYEIPNESRGLRLHFEPAGPPRDYAGIRVDLGR